MSTTRAFKRAESRLNASLDRGEARVEIEKRGARLRASIAEREERVEDVFVGPLEWTRLPRPDFVAKLDDEALGRLLSDTSRLREEADIPLCDGGRESRKRSETENAERSLRSDAGNGREQLKKAAFFERKEAEEFNVVVFDFESRKECNEGAARALECGAGQSGDPKLVPDPPVLDDDKAASDLNQCALDAPEHMCLYEYTMDAINIQNAKEKLLALKRELEGELEKTPEIIDMGNDPSDPQGEEADEAELAQSQTSIRDSFARRLDDVRSALNKIEQGTYGMCEQCDMEIEEEVLAVDPESRECKMCKHAA